VLLGVAVVVVVVVLVATSGGDDEEEAAIGDIERGPDTAIEIPAGEPIVIGVSTALTGPSGQRGSEYRDAVIAGVERWKAENPGLIAGHDIEVRAEDDGCTEADHTAIAARRLLGRPGLVGVIGPQCSGGAMAASHIYAEAGVVAISGSATRTDLTTGQAQEGFFFRTAYRNDLEGTFIGQFLVDTIEADTVYVIDDNEPFGKDLANAAETLLREGDVRVIRRSIRQGDVDFGRFAAEIAAEDPDFVTFAGFNPEAALLYRQIRDAGYDGLFGAGDAAASVPSFVEPVGAEVAEGALFSGCQYPLSQDFLADFVEVHGHEPMATFTPQYADAVTVLLDAVKDVAVEGVDGSLEIQPKELRDAVRATNIEDGVSGALAFDSHGDRVPKPGDELSEVQETALAAQEDIFAALGLIPCQVQDGELVTLGGPGTGEIQLP
jgi:ABC-type branched-subunit amino acid transport system substrate-binding protein